MAQEESIRHRIATIEAEIADLRARLPKHSPVPSMLVRLEELEEDLAALNSKLDVTAGSDAC